MHSNSLFSTFLIPLALAGCAQVTDTSPPALGLAPAITKPGPGIAGDVSEQAWWESLGDKKLNTMVRGSLEQNLSLQAAVSRIAQAQANLDGTGISSALSGGATAQVRRSGSENGPTSEVRSAGISPSFFIDLFGATKHTRDAATAQLEASELDLGTARLSVVSGVVGAYVQARHLQKSVHVKKEAVEKHRAVTEMEVEKTRLGAGTELSAAQARLSLERAEKDLVDLETGYRNTVYALATLLAQPSDDVMASMSKAQPLPTPPSEQGAIPVDLLRNRPDVRSAEAVLAAAAASVGVAEAQLYPALTLSGNLSTAAGIGSWGFGPALSLPILNQPALRANVRGSEAAMEQAHIAWKSAVLAAVEDARRATNSYEGAKRAVATAENVRRTQQEVVELAEFSHELGNSPFSEVLDARSGLDDAKLAVLTARRDRVQAWSELQVATGRGWARECHELCVSGLAHAGFRYSYALKRSSNMI
ncbi:efflux transporter outer membrane subunit, partial [Loktanella sp. SALINAS62]|uniref:efflux transporter outer membrane subunit n=1 Tax=Loktanella sp. SALINAS62 TaxID=2706124 RepID=UPI001B8B7A47